MNFTKNPHDHPTNAGVEEIVELGDSIYEAFQAVKWDIYDALAAPVSPVSAVVTYGRVEVRHKKDQANEAKRPKLFAVLMSREDMHRWREAETIVQPYLKKAFGDDLPLSDAILLLLSSDWVAGVRLTRR